MDAGFFPASIRAKSYRDLQRCRLVGCKRCSRNGESVTIHKDCWNIFKLEYKYKTKEKLFRLWTAACWRYPWRSSPPTLLPSTIDAASVMNLAMKKGVAPDHWLPPELCALIWESVPQRLMWCRFQYVSELAKLLSKAKSRPLVSLPLRGLLAWERGQRVPMEAEQAVESNQVICLTIDTLGLKRIERLSSVDDKRGGTKDEAFGLINGARCPPDVYAIFLVCISPYPPWRSPCITLELPSS